MRMSFALRILLVVAGLACLIGPALLIRERADTAVGPTSRVSGDAAITIVRTGGSLK